MASSGSGCITSPALPPRYAVRAYLREQGAKLSEFLSHGVGRLGWDCAEAYQYGTASTKQLEVAANGFQERARSAGTFMVIEGYIPPARAFPQRERCSVSAFLMQPIGLTQPSRTGTAPYTEEAVLLRTIQSVFRRKRASFGFGTGSLILTRHLLERVYERTEVHHEDFRRLIDTEFADLLRGVALARVAGIHIDATDSAGKYRVGAVPYSNGLMRFEARALVADPKTGDLSFRLDVPSFQDHSPFVNPTSIIEGTISCAPELLALEVTCGVTYLNVTQLSDSELQYLYTFNALKGELGTDVLDELSDAYCAPQFPHERPRPVPISDRVHALIRNVRGLLNDLALHPSRSAGVCLLVPSEYGRT